MIKVFYWGLRTATFALPYVEQAFFNWNIGLEKKNSVISGEGSWLTKKNTQEFSFLEISLCQVNVPQEALIWVVWNPIVI